MLSFDGKCYWSATKSIRGYAYDIPRTYADVEYSGFMYIPTEMIGDFDIFDRKAPEAAIGSPESLYF